MNDQKLLSKKCIVFISAVVGIVCLAGLIVPTPGHDTPYWISRLYLFAEEIRANGIWEFPFHIYSDCYTNYGYAAPLFYCDVFLLLPATMVAAGLPINTAYGFTLAFSLLLRFGFAYLAVKIALPQRGEEKGLNQYGFLFAFFYSFFPYMLDNAFERGAVGELIAGIFLPLVFACVYHIIHHKTISKGVCIWLAVGLFGVLCSHVVTTVLMGAVILVYVVAHLPVLWKEKKRFGMLVFSALIAVCLSAFWLLPFLEQFIVGNPGVTETIPENHALGIVEWFLPTELRDAFRLYILDDYNTVFQWEPSGFIYPLLLAVVLWVRFRKLIVNKTIKKCLLGAWAIVFAISCKPLIRFFSAPLGLIQFPWRILWLVGILTAVFLTYTLAKIKRNGWTVCAILVCIACATATSGIAWIRQVRFQEPIPNYKELGVDTLYLPEGAWWQLASERGEVVDSSDPGVNYTWERRGENVVIKYDGNVTETTFQLPLHYYWGYTAYDTVNECYMDVSKSDIGLVNVTIAEFDSGSILVSYTGTGIQKFSKVLSIFSWLAVVVYMVAAERKKRYLRKISEISGNERMKSDEVDEV